MRLTRIHLANLRNYAQGDLEPAPGLNLFVGDNAQGKSNLLEAISLLGTGKSFRASRESEVIAHGLDAASVVGEAHVRAGTIRLGCTIASTARGTRKLYTINGQSVRYANFLGQLRVVTFVPADLDLAAGSPAARRSFLNTALAQEDGRYYRELARYQKTLSQKNALLRSGATDADLLAIYNDVLVASGTAVMLARAHFITQLAVVAARVHAQWSSGEQLDVAYRPNVEAEVLSEDAVAFALQRALRAAEPQERVRQACLAGPHRDDVVLELNGNLLGAFGSQGQQRTAVLALKVGEYTIMRDASGEAPLLLLDDVLSELDPSRAAAFLRALSDYEQAFLTATHLAEQLPAARTWLVRNGTVRAA